ncbi:MAG: DNA alkylation repair protein [Bacteroidales bacterium]|nr:DNA alkylation repair protein [Bacteroidales bacterium]
MKKENIDTPCTTAEDIKATLLELGSEKQSKIQMRFFKTGKGDYGEGDKFLGVMNPNVRLVVKEAWKSTSLEVAATLAKDEWHEVRLCGLLIMVEKMLKAYKKKDDKEMEKIVRLYLSLHPYINNWDLVDLSAIKIVGNWEVAHPEDDLMDKWIRLGDDALWQRRIAMLSTWMTLRNGRFDMVMSRAECLLSSKQNLLHKAAGWMLREMYKAGGEAELDSFLRQHIKKMPSVMLSYACEKMSADEKAYWREFKYRETD